MNFFVHIQVVYAFLVARKVFVLRATEFYIELRP